MTRLGTLIALCVIAGSAWSQTAWRPDKAVELIAAPEGRDSLAGDRQRVGAPAVEDQPAAEDDLGRQYSQKNSSAYST